MEFYNNKPLIKINWEMKSSGHFETFPETTFYANVGEVMNEVKLVALVKSSLGDVCGITSEGDAYDDIYEKSQWSAKVVFDYLADLDPTLTDGFKYHHGDACVCNSNGVVVAHCNGIKACDGTWIDYENVRPYMIDDLVAQWRLLQPGVEWDIFKLYDDLEDRYSKTSKDIPFTLDVTKVPIIYIKNEHGFIIAKQGDTEHNDDFVGLIQEDGTFDDSPWKDLTEDKIKCHLKIWEDFGKDMSQTEKDIANGNSTSEDVVTSTEMILDIHELFDYLQDKYPGKFESFEVQDCLVIAWKDNHDIFADDEAIHKHDMKYGEFTKSDVDKVIASQVDNSTSECNDKDIGEAPIQKWFVCYRVRIRERELLPILDECYDGVFEFDPTNSLTKLKDSIASYQNRCHNNEATYSAIDFSNITIVSLTKLA